MTYKTKNLVFLFAFASMMLAWPMLSTQTAEAADGEVTISGVCGITVPGNVNLGTLVPNTEGSESSVLEVTTDGSVTGTFEIKAGDWKGVATKSTGSITLVDMVATDTVTIKAEVFTAGATDDANTFTVSANQITSAANLATAINLNSADDATAIASENVVLIRSTTTGTVAANAIALLESESADGSIVLSAATLTGAEDAGVTHMESTVTRYSVTNTGVDPGASDYATKGAANAFLVETADKVVITETNPNLNIKMKFQLTGVGTLINLPYSGALTQTLAFTTVCSE